MHLFFLDKLLLNLNQRGKLIKWKKIIKKKVIFFIYPWSETQMMFRFEALAMIAMGKKWKIYKSLRD